METLAELQKLRQQLQAMMSRLMQEAENNPESLAALSYTRIASECQRLERHIDLLTKDVLDQHPHDGVA